MRKAHSEYRSWLPDLKRKRAAVKPHEVPQVYRRPLLVDYFLLGRKRFSDLPSAARAHA